MVGMVIVSHSRPLAEALLELVRQVASATLPMAIAAGVGEERQEFGTDAVEIMEAIQSVYSPDGVLVLMDLGSAILSAEMARDLLPPEIVEKLRFCPAPIVEGAIAAGVQIGLGMDLDTVCREASGAMLPKVEQLAPETLAVPMEAPQPAISEAAAEQVVLTLKNQHGLHARPAARFVQTAAAFNADIRVRNLSNQKGPVSAKSLNALATLGAVHDHQIAISASGQEATQALQALSRLVEQNFGETPTAEAPSPTRAPVPPVARESGALQAVPVSDGIALAPLARYQPALPPIPQDKSEDPEADWKRLQKALETTQKAIRQRRTQLAASLGEEQTAIFDAHLLILQDPDLIEQVRERIFKQHDNAAAAWHTIIQATADSYRSLDDPYQQQRAADVMDVGNQVLFALAEKTVAAEISFEQPVILFAAELTPTETAQLDMRQVLGLITVGGGPTSHSAILARALGIPALSGVNPMLEDLPAGTLLAVDGFNGQLWINPPQATQNELNVRREEWLAQRQELVKTSHTLAATRDGKRVEVVANIGNVFDAKTALSNGAEGIGLLRTEFLFLTRDTPPSEAEQFDALRQICEAMAADGQNNRPIIVRTLDVGGDKALPYLPMPAEMNPFLGVRAIRMSLRNPEIFSPQLRAILRAGADYNLRLMFPMIANLEEVLQARLQLEETHHELEKEGLAHRWPIETGIMVEIPSAALLSQEIARAIDFFSIGTNDLTQYTLAAERGNPALSDFTDALHPAVLRLIQQVVQAAHAQGKWVGVCGELAGDPLAAPVLVGLGVDELSLNPGGIPKIKAVLRELDSGEAKELAGQVLQVESANAARQLARDFFLKKLETTIL